MTTPHAISIPPIEVFARAVGKIKFTCPNCTQEYPLQNIQWRRSNITCSRCHVKYQIGLGFDTVKLNDAYLMGKWNSYIANTWRRVGTPIEGTRLHGSVEWACHSCNAPQKGFLNYENKLTCQSCAKDFYVAALLYRLPKVGRLKLRAPFDSIVKGIQDETKIIQSVDTPQIGSGAGTPSNGARNPS